MAGNEKEVRLQVPVTEDLAAELAYLADRLERSVAWLANEMLIEVMKNRANTAEWLGMSVLGLLSDAKKLITGKRRRSQSEQGQVRLQLTVTPELAADVTKLAERSNLTPVKMAGLLLQAAVAQNDMIIEAITSKPMRALLGKKPRGVGSKGTADRKAAPA